MNTHSYAEIYARDFEEYGCARISLNRSGEPARNIGCVHRSVTVTRVEQLRGYRTRITLETGRTMTMCSTRWVLAEHIQTASAINR